MSAAKRKRTANFSIDEKIQFLHILQKKGQVIINQVNTTDARTNRKKEEAWKEITHELNASGNVQVGRTTDQIKKIWQKMKTEFKKKQLNANKEEGGEPSKKIDDPVLELVAEITSSGSSKIEYFNCVYKEENGDRMTFKSQWPIKRLRPTEVEVEAVPPESESDRLWPTDAEEIVTPHQKSQLQRLRLSIDADEAVAANPQTPFQKFRPSKVVVENVKPNKPTQLQNHLKRRWPFENDTGSMKDELDANFVNERLKCEKEKGALIELQKQHMAQEHALKIKNEELKTTILEVVLKKIQDVKPVNSDLIKIMSNM